MDVGERPVGAEQGRNTALGEPTHFHRRSRIACTDHCGEVDDGERQPLFQVQLPGSAIAEELAARVIALLRPRRRVLVERHVTGNSVGQRRTHVHDLLDLAGQGGLHDVFRA